MFRHVLIEEKHQPLDLGYNQRGPQFHLSMTL